MYSSMIVAAEPVTRKINVPDLIRQTSEHSSWDTSIEGGGGILTNAQASRVICGLTQLVDK